MKRRAKKNYGEVGKKERKKSAIRTAQEEILKKYKSIGIV